PAPVSSAAKPRPPDSSAAKPRLLTPARRSRASFPPFPVAEDVGSVLILGFFSVSANGVLAYRAGPAQASSPAQLSWFDRAGRLLDNAAPAAYYSGSIRLSPDGKLAVVDQTDDTQNRDIWILDMARGASMRFTFDGAYDVLPVWSPDGWQIVFSSDREPGGVRSLYRKAANGSAPEELLLKTGATLYATSWSADGRYLMYESSDPKGANDLWVLPMQSGAPAGKPV